MPISTPGTPAVSNTGFHIYLEDVNTTAQVSLVFGASTYYSGAGVSMSDTLDLLQRIVDTLNDDSRWSVQPVNITYSADAQMTPTP